MAGIKCRHCKIVGKNCNCSIKRRRRIGSSPSSFRSRTSSSKPAYDPKADFVPFESILDDYTETCSPCSRKLNSSCCIHGAPCELSTLCDRSLKSGSTRSESEYIYAYEPRKMPLHNVASSSTTIQSRSRSQSSCPSFPKLFRQNVYEKVGFDHQKRNRWPLSELMGSVSGGTRPAPPPPPSSYISFSSPELQQKNANNHDSKKKPSEAFYDFCKDYSGAIPSDSASGNDDAKSDGRRKDKKKKIKFENIEKYPKLESVLEDTGYFELQVSKSGNSDSKISRSYMGGPRSSRRKNKKTRLNSDDRQMRKQKFHEN